MATQESPAPLQGTECILHQASPQLKSQSPNPQDTLGAHQEGEGGGQSHFADEPLRPRVQLSHGAGGDTAKGPQLPEHLPRLPSATSVPEGLGHRLGKGSRRGSYPLQAVQKAKVLHRGDARPRMWRFCHPDRANPPHGMGGTAEKQLTG